MSQLTELNTKDLCIFYVELDFKIFKVKNRMKTFGDFFLPSAQTLQVVI